MAYIKIKDKDIANIPYLEFNCDTMADLSSLPKNVVMGSIANIITTGEKYKINSLGQWIKQP